MGNCSFSYNAQEDARVKDHPCYSESAHHFFARIHLAVAPACNIQCNYCNRKYDCANESRPGVVSQRLKPEEALQRVYAVADQVKELSVVGIAGPGDALANAKRTFETLLLIRSHFPDLKLCLSTNGLALPDYVDDIVRTGVDHVTVTMNTLNPDTAAKIYEWVVYKGQASKSREAYEYFMERQQEGIRRLAAKGVLVKVNSLLIPGVNDAELPALSKKVKLMGAFMHNIMPLISRPEHGTAFGLAGMPEPTEQELEAVRGQCGDIKQMAHCRQCRADAVGKLDEDRFADFEEKNPVYDLQKRDNNRAKREEYKKQIESFKEKFMKPSQPKDSGDTALVALCTKGMGIVNQHFGHAKEFHIYRVTDGSAELVNVRRVDRAYCAGPSECPEDEPPFDAIAETIKDCDAVVSLKVGYGPHKKLEKMGVLPVTDTPYLPLEEAAVRAAEQAADWKKKPSDKKEAAI